MQNHKISKGTILIDNWLPFLITFGILKSENIHPLIYVCIAFFLMYIFWRLVKPPMMYKITPQGIQVRGKDNQVIPWTNISHFAISRPIKKTYIQFSRVYVMTWEPNKHIKHHPLKLRWLFKPSFNEYHWDIYCSNEEAIEIYKEFRLAYRSYGYPNWPMDARIEEAVSPLICLKTTIESHGDQNLKDRVLPIIGNALICIENKTNLPYEKLVPLFIDEDILDKFWEQLDKNSNDLFIESVIKTTDLLGLDPVTKEYYQNN